MSSNSEIIKDKVKSAYSKIADNYMENKTDACCESDAVSLNKISEAVKFDTIPSLGCDRGLINIANPLVDEIVIDLGSGPGRDAIEVANKVKSGKVIGIDMTDEMLKLARNNADSNNLDNVEFKKGEITNIPLEDNLANLVISNCVFNLEPDKEAAFKEAYRVLKPQGRIVISDMITLVDLKEENQLTDELYCSCIGGATSEENYRKIMESVGFNNIEVIRQYEEKFKSNGKEIPYASTIFIGYK